MTAVTDSRNGNREQEVAMISRSLKAVAKELDIPIIALSQLNRSVESRGGNKRPQLSDLRESGAIEQDADLVAFIHRPEYYGLTVDEDGTPTQGMAEIIVAKHRNGAVDTIKLRFRKEQARFTDYDEDMGVYGGIDSAMNTEFASSLGETPGGPGALNDFGGYGDFGIPSGSNPGGPVSLGSTFESSPDDENSPF